MEPILKKRFKLRRKHVKKAVLVTTYGLVVVMMIASMILPGLQ